MKTSYLFKMMIYLLNNKWKIFDTQIQFGHKIILAVILFFSLQNNNALAQSNDSYNAQLRTAETIGTVTKQEFSKHSRYTKILYLGIVLKVYTHIEYTVGEKLMIAYDPDNIYNAAPILEKPYFEKGELSDTTEGVLHISNTYSCTIIYKTYSSADSFNIIIMHRNRYLSPGMFDTLAIKENCIYKIIYNKKSGKAEVLFHDVVDSTHQKTNKHLFSALQQITNGFPIEALGDLNECVLSDSKNADYYYYQRGKMKEGMREYKNAEEDFTRYIDIKPNDRRGYLRRATVYIQIGNIEAAQRDVNKLFSINDQDPEANYLQGVIYYHKKEYQQAIDFYSTAIKYSKGVNLEVYYYDRAQARKKLYGKKDKKCKYDYYMAKKIAKKNDLWKIHGNQTHQEKLKGYSNNFYVAWVSDNTLSFNSAISSNMQGELKFPYTVNNVANTFDKTFSLNGSKQNTSFTLGLWGVELGGFKRMYGRSEFGFVLNDGNSSIWSIRSVLGYNVKISKKNIVIFRPEMGFTYLGRVTEIGTIGFNRGTQINIMGKNFIYKRNSKTNADNVDVTLRENVLSLSPAIGFWLWPFSSKLVMRIGFGYNFVLVQKYSVLYSSYKDHLRER
ncbi:MAG TPA: tetratricopeptide repeat protein, partial [Cytophaga sp.]|nr:tetratricopeptide repeat protein [Cytophaga sp.]